MVSSSLPSSMTPVLSLLRFFCLLPSSNLLHRFFDVTMIDILCRRRQSTAFEKPPLRGNLNHRANPLDVGFGVGIPDIILGVVFPSPPGLFGLELHLLRKKTDRRLFVV